MSKLDLTYKEKIHLDKWDIDVVPQLTLQEMKLIVDIAKNQKDSFERDEAILASVIAACTDIYNNEDDDYTYEEIIYSGLWNDIIEACPILASNIKNIYNKIDEERSIENSIIKLVNKITEAIDNVNISSDDINNFIKSLEGKVE